LLAATIRHWESGADLRAAPDAPLPPRPSCWPRVKWQIRHRLVPLTGKHTRRRRDARRIETVQSPVLDRAFKLLPKLTAEELIALRGRINGGSTS
jgi:hypothetical protein